MIRPYLLLVPLRVNELLIALLTTLIRLSLLIQSLKIHLSVPVLVLLIALYKLIECNSTPPLLRILLYLEKLCRVVVLTVLVIL